MLISLSTASLYIYPLRSVFSLAKRAGFDGLELVVNPEVEWRGVEYVRRLEREYSLPVVSVHPPLFGYPGWKGLTRSIAPFLERALSITRGIGARLLVIHSPWARSLDDPIGCTFVERVTRAGGELHGPGPQISLETMTRARAGGLVYVLRRPAEQRAFADEHDLSLTLDTCHLATWELDPVEWLESGRERLANVHFSDLSATRPSLPIRLSSLSGAHQLPGAGHLPLASLVRALSRCGYTGPITYELSPAALEFWSPRRVAAHLRDSVAFVRACE